MLRIGHRGAAGYAPENTLSSIRRAIDLECHFIEVDIQATLDGKLVLFHDKLLDRVTDSSGYLWAKTYKELQDISVQGSEKIPLLEEVCDLLKNTHAGICAEIISFGIEKEALRILTNALPNNRLCLASFSHASILAAKQANTDIRTVALIEGIPIRLEAIIEDSECDFIGLGFESITREAIAAAHKCGVSALAWTVDDPREIERAYLLGVDGIFSNYPDRIRK